MAELFRAVRALRRSPAFVGLALLVLTLGIGVTTAIFTLLDAVLLKPLPYPDADRLVAFTYTYEGRMAPRASPAKFNVWQLTTTAIDEHAALRFRPVQLQTAAGASQVSAGHVNAAFFRLLGAPLQRGRAFLDAEDVPGMGTVVVLGHGFWQRRFGGDPGVVGRVLNIDGRARVVVGILGREFDTTLFGFVPDVWLPLELSPDDAEQIPVLQVFGRLRPGVTLEQARAQDQLAAVEFRRRFPDAMLASDVFRVEPFAAVMLADFRLPLAIVGGAVCIMLLAGGANVAGLMLVRASARRREIAVRTALGASRRQIGTQIFAESLVLSVLAGAAGIPLAIAGIRAMVSLVPSAIPRIGEGGSGLVADWRVLLFASVVSLLTAALCSVLPAITAAAPDIVGALKEARGTRSRRSSARQASLVIGQLALAVVLTIGAGLLVRTWWALATVDRGFDPHDVQTMRMSLANSRFARTPEAAALVREGVERLAAVPGVAGAAAACCLPLESDWRTNMQMVGRPLEISVDDLPSERRVSPTYFDVLRIPVLRGRAFEDSDSPARLPVAIINQSMARRFWPDSDPLGERVRLFPGVVPESDTVPRTIIGIVGDVRDGLAMSAAARPTVYVPLAQLLDRQLEPPLAWIVRTTSGATLDQAGAGRALREASGGLPIFDVTTLDAIGTTAVASTSFQATLIGLFGAAALLLAAIGIYGLLAHSVHQREYEMGVRLTLGAEPAMLRWSVVGEALWLAARGTAIGVVFALGLTRALEGLLFGVTARDPVVFLAVPVALALVAAVGAWLPARRAALLDPVDVLRRS